MMPVWVAVLGRVVLGELLPRLAVVGIVVGFVGVAILVGPTALGATGALDAAGLVAILISPSPGRPARSMPRTGRRCQAIRWSRPGCRWSLARASSR